MDLYYAAPGIEVAGVAGDPIVVTRAGAWQQQQDHINQLVDVASAGHPGGLPGKTVTAAEEGGTDVHMNQRMDQHLDEKQRTVLPNSAASLPVVLILHGGLWYSGSRNETAEVCQNLATLHSIHCATADYPYSQNLGGCCNATADCPAAFVEQARAAVSAVAALRTAGLSGPVYLGGHSAGGHLAALLAMEWAQYAPKQSPPPAGFFGVEGIYNVSLWDSYDCVRWDSRFHCATRQAFGALPAHASEWLRGSPAWLARSATPAGPLLLVHSPGDDWVQETQATDLFAALQPPANGRTHRLDTAGVCANGEHPEVLVGGSALKLAACIAQLAKPTLPTG